MADAHYAFLEKDIARVRRSCSGEFDHVLYIIARSTKIKASAIPYLKRTIPFPLSLKLLRIG